MKNALLMGTALAVAMISTAAQAQTEQQPAAADDDGGARKRDGDIVVTGLRTANNAAIEAKQEATNIIDAVGANDVRSLPDNTVVEALKRIPGIAIFPTNDNEHTQDESVSPAIRGLGPAYNNVTLDGLSIASPGTPNGIIGNITRGVRLDILPTSMISQLQVVKSFTPDLDPNAVGGAINIVTRSAFENGGKPFFTMEAGLGHASEVSTPHSQPDPGYRASMTGSTTFGANHNLGITVSGNYETLSSYTVEHATFDTGYYNFYDATGKLQTGAAMGNGIPVPNQDRYWYNPTTRTRWGVTAKFEIHASDALNAFVMGGYYDFKTHYERNENELSLAPNSQTTVLNQTATSGSFPTGAVRVGYMNDHIDQTTKLVQAGLDWRPSDRQLLSIRASASSANYDEHSMMIKYGTGITEAAPGTGGTKQVGTSAYGFSYDTSKFDFAYTLPTAQYYNLANYTLSYYRPDVGRTSTDDLYTVRADYAFNRGASDRGIGFAIGGSFSDDSPKYGVDRIDLEQNTNAAPLTLANGVGSISVPFPYTNVSLITINTAAALAQLNALNPSALNTTNQLAFDNQDDFTHHERTVGAYALLGYRSDALSAEAGFHVDDTQQQTVARVLVKGAFQDAPSSSSYRYFLPSAILTWHATPSLNLRGAFSQTIGRPSYDALASRSSISFVNASDEGNPDAQGVSVTVGNPNLKPRLSTNYDLSLDWVPSKRYGGIVSIAGFYKDIAHEIFTANTVGYTYQGVTYANAQVSQPVNSSGASIKGVELNGILNSLGFVHPWLSGFGVSGNVSIYSGRITVPLLAGGSRTLDNLVNQPGDTENASLFYTSHGLELRAAWNRQGKSLRAIQNEIYWQDLYWAPRDQLDLSASYSLKNGASFFVQASNVTHNRIVALTGPKQNLLRDDYTVPTTVWVGLRFTPHF